MHTIKYLLCPRDLVRTGPLRSVDIWSIKKRSFPENFLDGALCVFARWHAAHHPNFSPLPKWNIARKYFSEQWPNRWWSKSITGISPGFDFTLTLIRRFLNSVSLYPNSLAYAEGVGICNFREYRLFFTIGSRWGSGLKSSNLIRFFLDKLFQFLTRPSASSQSRSRGSFKPRVSHKTGWGVAPCVGSHQIWKILCH